MTDEQSASITCMLVALAMMITTCKQTARITYSTHVIDSLQKQHAYDSTKIHYLEGQVDLLNVCKERLP